MDDYRADSYGDGMADVYDDWYVFPGDLDEAVEALAAWSQDGPILELGVGTGRVAIPLVLRGLDVWGVDASTAMIERLRSRPGGESVRVLVGDMAHVEAPGDTRFSLAFCAFNSFFNLTSEAAQSACLNAVRRLLRPGGRLVVEAFVPRDGDDDSEVEVWRVQMDRVVLSISRRNREAQMVLGQAVELSERGIRLRPWAVRYLWPDQLDKLAEAAGLRLEGRWENWSLSPFVTGSKRHVSVYRPV